MKEKKKGFGCIDNDYYGGFCNNNVERLIKRDTFPIKRENTPKNQRGKKLTLNDLVEIARKKNIKLLSEYGDYKNRNSLLKWKCMICDFEFKKSTFNIQRGLLPCPECYDKKRSKYHIPSESELREKSRLKNLEMLMIMKITIMQNN